MLRVLSLLLVVSLAACASTGPETPTATPTVVRSGVSLDAIEGAPPSVTSTLTAAFQSTASGRGLRASENTQAYGFRGFFSVVGSSAGTLLIYVWDVSDPDGNRVTRISGQINSPAVAADPWQVVEASMVLQAVSETFDTFEAWVAANGAGV